MITISRMVDPREVVELVDLFPLPDQPARELFAQQLVHVMATRPETVLVLVARSDKSGIIGFIVAELAVLDTVNLRQAWIHSAAPWQIGIQLNDRVKLWAVGHGRSRIEVRTQRSSEALYRRYGFVEDAKILVQTIPDDFTQRLLEAVSLEEVPNG